MAAVTDSERLQIVRAASERVGPGASVGTITVEGDLLIAPLNTFDSVGMLLHRRSGEIIVLGSAISLEHYAWAYAQNFKLHAPNRLVITAVRQPDGAHEVLRAALTPRVLHDRPLDLRRLPITLQLDWPQTALLIEHLRTSDAFDYTVMNP